MRAEAQVRVVPFDAEAHVDECAGLVADAHAAVVQGAPAAGYDTYFAHRELARFALDGAGGGPGPAVVAVSGSGSVVGFLLSTLVLGADGAGGGGGWPPAAALGGPREARIRLAHHAAVEDGRRAIYRAMYSAVAGRFVEHGCFRHEVSLPVVAVDAVSAWFELGFGVDQILGLRSTEPVPGAPVDGVRIRLAEADDLEALTRLAVDLTLFHARPPILAPAFVTPAGARAGLEATLLRDDGRSAIWLAESPGAGVVGFFEFGPEARAARTVRLGIAVVAESSRSAGLGTALLDAGLRWARSASYDFCLVGWTSTNPLSDPFWRRSGFVPTYYTLARLVDDRVTWAGASGRDARPSAEGNETGC